MTRFRLATSFVLAVLAACLAVGGGRVAYAHNSFESSDPADGSSLAAAPTSIAITFANDVPLDSASVQVIDPSGVRTEVTGLTHGASERVVVAPLPALAPGEISVRWRLVSSDGHAITGRIGFAIAAAPAAPSTIAAAAPGAVVAPPAGTTPATPTSVPTTVPAAVAGDTGDADDAGGAPAPLRWFLRYASYLAILAVVGLVLTDRLVWPGVAARPQSIRVLAASLGATAVLAVVHLLVLASDLTGDPLSSAFDDLGRAASTEAGIALGLRVLLAAVIALLLAMPLTSNEVRWTAIGIAGVLMMGTWAWAGHARSQRWPELGVPLDIAHHVAAALWIGALAIVGLVALRELDGAERAGVVVRLSSVAAASVGIVVVTGALQTLRLVGSPLRLLDGRHGVYLIAKLVVLAAMLAIAANNRRRVGVQFARPAVVEARSAASFRQAVLAEFALGLIVVAITASLVVSVPAVANGDDATDPVAEIDPAVEQPSP
jgi:copper transport protein